jgi:hypothetical protein
MADVERDELSESFELAVVRLHNGELAEDIVEGDVSEDSRVIHSRPISEPWDNSTPASAVPGTLPRETDHS